MGFPLLPCSKLSHTWKILTHIPRIQKWYMILLRINLVFLELSYTGGYYFLQFLFLTIPIFGASYFWRFLFLTVPILDGSPFGVPISTVPISSVPILTRDPQIYFIVQRVWYSVSPVYLFRIPWVTVLTPWWLNWRTVYPCHRGLHWRKNIEHCSSNIDV